VVEVEIGEIRGVVGFAVISEAPREWKKYALRGSHRKSL
jgi:hypothetical protein